MDEEYNQRPGWVRLPGYGDDSESAPGSGHGRASHVRAVRRASNWAAAALIAGVAAAAGYLAHHTQSAVPATTTLTPGSPSSASTASPGRPALPLPVATSSGSAVSQEDGHADN